MTAQDADESDSESSQADATDPEQGDDQPDETTASNHSDGQAKNAESERSVERTAPTEPVEEFLSEIAEAPDGHIDDVLATIMGDDESDNDNADSETTVGIDTPIDPSEGTVSETLRSELADTPTDQIAQTLVVMRAEIDRLNDQLAETEQQADDLESRLARKQADFENYKKRQKQRLEDEKQRATEDLVERLLDVRDNLARALDQDEETDIRGGVESTLEQFDQQLDRENVERIEPVVGGETDPRRHEVLATIASDQPEDTIAQVHRPGYLMGEKVLRPAQVAVSDGSLDDEE